MSNASKLNLELLYDYLYQNSVRESGLLARLREETLLMPLARMQIAPEQGQFMALLVRLMSAAKAIEVGTFTGYSSLCIAGALPDNGTLICCDTSQEWTDIAKRYWQEAQLEHKIQLKLQPALQTLEELIAQGQANTFDFLFLDADKENYLQYYEKLLTLARPGGLIAIDNVLWSGRVADTAQQDPETNAIRALNAFIKADTRVDVALVPIADGLSLARKR